MINFLTNFELLTLGFEGGFDDYTVRVKHPNPLTCFTCTLAHTLVLLVAHASESEPYPSVNS